MTTLSSADLLPDLVQASTTDPLGWLRDHRDALRSATHRHGAVRVRGLDLASVEAVSTSFAVLADELTDDVEAFAQRGERSPGIYTSATWPDNQPMCMHHELSYRSRVPSLLLMACLQAPAEGGATGIADAAAVADALPVEVVQRLDQQGWQLIRTYGTDIGPHVEQAFGTADRAAIEAYGRAEEIEMTWLPDGSLQTVQRRPALVTHPVTGRRCFVNQIAFLSEWTLEPEIREFLVDVYGVEGLPFRTAYGDGGEISAETIETINEVYTGLTRSDPWQGGDLLLVDNLASAHSREPFTGAREVLVGLADPVRLTAAGGSR